MSRRLYAAAMIFFTLCFAFFAVAAYANIVLHDIPGASLMLTYAAFEIIAAALVTIIYRNTRKDTR